MSDQSSMLATGGIGAAITVGTLIFARILIPAFNASNHKRIRSVCCGYTCISSLDVEETTPTVRVVVPDASAKGTGLGTGTETVAVVAPAAPVAPPVVPPTVPAALMVRTPSGLGPTPLSQPRLLEVLRRAAQ